VVACDQMVRAPGWAGGAGASDSALAIAADGGAGGDAPTKVNPLLPPPAPLHRLAG
jgi:hypothetical protein